MPGDERAEGVKDIVTRFHNHKMSGVEPPAWVKAWSKHAEAQPLRAAVHPEALGAAVCCVQQAK